MSIFILTLNESGKGQTDEAVWFIDVVQFLINCSSLVIDKVLDKKNEENSLFLSFKVKF